MKTQATVQWRDMPTLFVTLEHEGMRLTVHVDGLWPVLKPYQVNGSNFLYRLKDGSVIDIWQMDKADFDIYAMTPITKVVNEYFTELWAVFGHRAQPFTPREEWLPGILEQL